MRAAAAAATAFPVRQVSALRIESDAGALLLSISVRP
jgi:hypothetical protein